MNHEKAPSEFSEESFRAGYKRAWEESVAPGSHRCQCFDCKAKYQEAENRATEVSARFYKARSEEARGKYAQETSEEIPIRTPLDFWKEREGALEALCGKYESIERKKTGDEERGYSSALHSLSEARANVARLSEIYPSSPSWQTRESPSDLRSGGPLPGDPT